MNTRSHLLAVVVCFCCGSLVHGQADKVFLRLEPGGPASTLTAVAFSPDGERLYAAGFDKVVRVWALNKKDGTFEPSNITYRVPVGPGTAGTINALAVSPDGNWIAAGGLGVMRGTADYRTVGMVFPALGTKTPAMREDEGTIFVFNVNNERQVKLLRSHPGAILALSFLPAQKDKPPLLVSAAQESIDNTEKYAAGVRLWNVATGMELAKQTFDVKEPSLTPGLIAWHTGAKPDEVAVAVAWWDGALRVWDVAGNRVRKSEDNKFNNTVAHLSKPGQFLTAGFHSPNGVLRSWQTDAEQQPSAPVEPKLRLLAEDPRNGPFYLPLDLAAFANQGEGALDRAVVLARRQEAKRSDGDKDVLFLLDLATNKVLARRTLGAFRFNLRRLAVSPTGKHVAVADGDNQQVLIFSITDVVKNEEKSTPQVLKGVGSSVKVVSFRKKGDDLGLYLEEVDGGKMVFDFNNRRLVADDAAWKRDAPDRIGWDVTPKVEGNRVVITVSGPDFKARTVVVGERCTVTAGALLPPRKGGGFGPVLAVGWLDEHKQPMLALYDVASGTPVRQFAGHVGAIHSLTFSADGRFLASAAADQTVCLWAMTSLDQVLGKAGALPGVVVVKDKNLEVTQTPDGSPLKKGTVVEGIVEEGKVRELATPRDFHATFFNTRPGTEVVLRVRQPGAEKAVDIKVKAGQGTDERKPLLSLFVTRGDKPEQREWIAWTSMGPYDASTRRAENYLGWHFNPDKPEDPIDFARAEKYRDKYEAKGILAEVIQHANATKAFDAWKKKPLPVMEVSVDGLDPNGPRLGDRSLVRTRALTLRVKLPPGFPVERVNAVRWRLGDGEWQTFDDGQEGPWSVDLAALRWGRGAQLLGVRLEVDANTRHFEKTVAFHYLPERPRLEFPKKWLEMTFPDAARSGLVTTTKKESFLVEAEVRPGTPGRNFVSPCSEARTSR